MRVGVVGCGYWGSKHLRVLSNVPDVSAIVGIDSSPDRRHAVQRTLRNVTTFGTLAEALPHLDAAVVATPPETHVAIASALLRDNKDVLVEKPLATSVTGARALADLAADRACVLMVGHTFEYNRAVGALRTIVQSGELGEVYHVDTARLNLGLYQADVDVFWDLAPHDISISNRILDATPQVVRAWGHAYAHRRLRDVGYLHLTYEALGIATQIHVSWLEPRKVRRVTVVGSHKMAVYNDLADDERLRIYDKSVDTAPASADERLHAVPPTYRNGGIVSPFVPFDEPLAVEDAHFVECVMTRGRPLSGAETGIAVVATLEAATRSLSEDRPVEVELVPAASLS